MKNEEFNIEKSTMRELTSQEVSNVAGGDTTDYISTVACLIRYTVRLTTGGDGIFRDGFDQEP